MADPRRDIEVQGLKQTALAGTPDGPHFNLGVLAVIDELERTGEIRFSHAANFVADRDIPGGLVALSPDEKTEAERQAQELGWTTPEGSQYAKGISYAQDRLRRFWAAT